MRSIWKIGEKFNSEIDWGMKPIFGKDDGIQITWKFKVATWQTELLEKVRDETESVL
jgi:hypothetical protein